MAAQEVKPVWQDKRQGEPEAWLRTLADEIAADPRQGATGGALQTTPELDALIDRLVAEGPRCCAPRE